MSMRTRLKNERGAALLETAVTLPIILLISVGIFEFGRAYQTWQVLTNAAREGARVAIIQGNKDADIKAAATGYMNIGQLKNVNVNQVTVTRNVGLPLGNTGTTVTIAYPFDFIVLNPVARLVVKSTGTGKGKLIMTAVATMRDEI